MATQKLKNELLALEKQFWQAMKDRDTAVAMRLTDDQCIVAGAQGVELIRREQLAKMLESPGWTLNDYRFADDAQVCQLGDDVAVIAYDVHEDLTVEVKPVALDAAESSTWVRRNGNWVCASHIESIRGDPFGRDRRATA